MRSRDSFIKQWGELETEFKDWRTYYASLSNYILAHKGRWLNQHHKIHRNLRQVNNKARIASRTLQGGLMAGITSPARPWFKLGTPDPDLNLYQPVRKYLSDVERIMREVFAQSNIYNSLYSVYGELGNFAVGPLAVYENFDNVIHTVPYTVGSYRLAINELGKVDTFYRCYNMTVDQFVKKFGETAVPRVARLFKDGSTSTKIKVLHCIEPNNGRDHMSPASWNKPVRSVYIDMEADKSGPEFIKKTGFDEFPLMVPRWDGEQEESYGTNCPGMDCLGDTKSLQLGERRSAQAVEKMVDPPLQAPSSFSRYVSNGGALPGEILIGDDPTGKGVRAIYDTSFRVSEHEEKLKEIEHRIDEAYYVDLFKMISNDTRSNITAREIVERHEEKLLLLGSVLERMHTELLDPLISRTYNIMNRAGILPTPPDELTRNGGSELSVNYISILAQAQRMAVLTDIQEFTGFVGNLSQLNPGAANKLNYRKAIDLYGEGLMVDPDMIHSDDEADEATRMQQQQAAAQQLPEQAKDVSQAVANVQQSDPAQDLLQRLTGSVA